MGPLPWIRPGAMEAAWALALLGRVGRGTGGAQVGQGGGGFRTYPGREGLQDSGPEKAALWGADG